MRTVFMDRDAISQLQIILKIIIDLVKEMSADII